MSAYRTSRRIIAPQASAAAARVIARIGIGLRAAIEREAMWQSTLHENYDNDFTQWLEYSDMYGLAARLGYTTAEEAWKANPTIQGSTNPADFEVVPEGEQMDMELNAALKWNCESCGSEKEPGEPCDCVRRTEARQPELSNATRAARRIAAAESYFVGEVFMPGMRTDPRNEGVGSVVIGGDMADVWATSAHADERDGVEGVTLVDTELRTTLDFRDLGSDELLDEVVKIIEESYNSIQEDTFTTTSSRFCSRIAVDSAVHLPNPALNG